MASCVFCRIVSGTSPASFIRVWDDAVAIIPLNPVVDGHLLVIPRRHVPDYTADPEVSAAAMRRAAELAAAGGPSNLITSRGAEATQTVRHLHLHLVPRTAGDGLLLPWSAQHTPPPPDESADAA